MTRPIRGVLIILTLCALSHAVTAQTKRTKRPLKSVKPASATVAAPEPTPAPTPEVVSPKRNERPGEGPANGAKPNASTPPVIIPVYFYEFSRPGFTYSRVLVEHDEDGKGKVSFQKSEFDELITDPVQLSPVTLGKIKEALSALNFLDSTETYQTARDYAHMGDTRITVKKAGRERTVKNNWTENKHAKALMDEYRRIANEYTWRFEVLSARENQPLLTPGMMATMESYLRRDEISDPPNLLQFLTQLSNDERLPLIARNHASRLIKEIEKKKK